MSPAQRVKEIQARLQRRFEPLSLELEDESYKHVGHAGAQDGRGHFRVLIVSDVFAEMSLLQRHRAVYSALGELMQTDIHALNIDAFSSAEL